MNMWSEIPFNSSDGSFTVVIPAYNAENSLEGALSSVLEQTLPPLEVVVVDDCSKDLTREVVMKAFAAFHAANVDLIYHCMTVNSGPSAARNAGLRLARGEYVAFIDSDDRWIPEKLRIVEETLRKWSSDFVCHSYTETLPAARARPLAISDFRVCKLAARNLLLRNPAQTSCVVVRASAGFQFDERMRYCEDYDLWLRIIASGRYALQLQGPALTVLGRPQGSAGGLSSNRVKMRLGELRAFYHFCNEQWFPRMLLFPGLVVFSLVKHALGGLLLRLAARSPQSTNRA
jgi:teichuronic acid biosynthesis glycosyltransferase TuaG